MELTVQNVYGLLLRSKLLSIDDCKTMFARWQEESRDGSTNLTKFAGWMVANRFVTDYQATLLARGTPTGSSSPVQPTKGSCEEHPIAWSQSKPARARRGS